MREMLMSFFLKKRKKKGSKDLNKAESRLIKSAYNLGYEVGYNHHSEIGWVEDELAKILEMAQECGLEEEVRSVYERAKKNGARDRDHAIASALSRKAPHDEGEERRRHTHRKPGTEEEITQDIEETDEWAPDLFEISRDDVARPTNRPEAIDRTPVINLPSFLNSLNFLRRR
ncbi:MAG TPA: hypothetical protein ENI32_07990 [Candidatus Syntrophoarchaeum butanivorans]|uniref:Uncharacterized protein n=1 Tax=Candidatus Syntropharchaeum butanivorans TaxID=1839936 RepID=A0A7J2S5D5_9EURY|nr:hypothetical protein [Candidatus Syntrophoarchaeum butanivorans]